MRAADNRYWPFQATRRADDETIAIFSQYKSSASILIAPGTPPHAVLDDLCPGFGVEEAIRLLEENSKKGNAGPIQDSLLAWFAARIEAIARNRAHRERLRSLPLYPTKGGLRPLTETILPGGFDDPLELVNPLNLDRVRPYVRFLRDTLGVEELTFQTYIETYALPAIDRGELDDDERNAFVQLLAGRLATIDRDTTLRERIVESTIIRCTDGKWATPETCYRHSESTEAILGGSARYVRVDSSTDALYTWLRIPDEPRTDDVVRRIKRVVRDHRPEGDTRAVMGRIFAFLAKKYPKNSQLPQDVVSLRDVPCLPSKYSPDWRSPAKVFLRRLEAVMGEEADYPELPDEVQDGFQQAIGVRREADTRLVVNHLLRCSSANPPARVRSEVYAFLDNHASDADLDRLIRIPCLLVEQLSGWRYITPQQAVKGEHKYGHFRVNIAEAYGKRTRLLERLKITAPNWIHARQVLREISENAAALDDRIANIVTHCWIEVEANLIQGIAAEGEIAESLGNFPTILNRDGTLIEPGVALLLDDLSIEREFPAQLAPYLIDLIQDTNRAKKAAGARSLRESAARRILDAPREETNRDLTTLISDRSRAVLRAVQAQQRTGNLPLTTGTTPLPVCVTASRILIEWHLTSRIDIQGTTRGVDAVFDGRDGVILVSRNTGKRGVESVARVLAEHLVPTVEPGPLTTQIYNALTASSAREAEDFQDRSGFPKLEGAAAEPVEGDMSAVLVDAEPVDEASEPEGSPVQAEADAAEAAEAATEPSFAAATRQASPPPPRSVQSRREAVPAESPEAADNDELDPVHVEILHTEARPPTADDPETWTPPSPPPPMLFNIDEESPEVEADEEASETIENPAAGAARTNRARRTRAARREGSPWRKINTTRTVRARTRAGKRWETIAVLFELQEGRVPWAGAADYSAFGCDILSFENTEKKDAFLHDLESGRMNWDLVERFVEVKGAGRGDPPVPLRFSQAGAASFWREMYWVYVLQPGDSPDVCVVNQIQDPAASFVQVSAVQLSRSPSIRNVVRIPLEMRPPDDTALDAEATSE